MAWTPLNLRSGNDRVDDVVRGTIERYLEEVHYLLAATRPPYGPNAHFANSCTAMLLATVGATAALPNYTRDGKVRKGDAKHFKNCLSRYFPWDDVTIEDDQFRTKSELVEQAPTIIYEVFRCPIFHSAGLRGGSDLGIGLCKIHPGTPDMSDAESRIADLVQQPTLSGQTILKLERQRCTLYVDYFYWCVRKLVEEFIADPINTRLILEHSLRKVGTAALQG